MESTEVSPGLKRYAAAVMAEIVSPLEALNNLFFLLQRRPQEAATVVAYVDPAQSELLKINAVARQALIFHERNEKNALSKSGEIRGMAIEQTIKHTDVLDGNMIIVELSDGSTVQVTLNEILRLHPKVQAEGEDDAN